MSLFNFIRFRLGGFLALGLLLLASTPVACGIVYGITLLLLLVVFGIQGTLKLEPDDAGAIVGSLFGLSLPCFYAGITLMSLRFTYMFGMQNQADRHEDTNNQVQEQFCYSFHAFFMALLCNLSLGLLCISVLFSTGAEDFASWCNGDLDAIQLTAFRAICVLCVASTIYTLGHAAIKLFFLPAILFLAEKRGNFFEALQFAWKTILAKPISLYCGILLIEIPFMFGFIFFAAVLIPFGLFFSYVTSSLFLTPIINTYILLVYMKAEKDIVLNAGLIWRWTGSGIVFALLICSPLVFRYYQGTKSVTMTQKVSRYLEEKEYDKAWATATAIPSATVMLFSFTREEAQCEVVLALVTEDQIDRAIHFADQVECDPWDNPPSKMSPWINKRYRAYRVIVSRLIDNEEFERARSFAVPRFSAEDSIFEKIDSAEKSVLPPTPE